jgi:hypothetical protein
MSDISRTMGATLDLLEGWGSARLVRPCVCGHEKRSHVFVEDLPRLRERLRPHGLEPQPCDKCLECAGFSERPEVEA